MVSVMCILSEACKGVLGSWAQDPWMASDLGLLVLEWSVLWQLFDKIGFISIAEQSSFKMVLSHVAYYQSDLVDWSCVNLRDPFMWYYFAPGRVHPLLQKWYSVACTVLDIAYSTLFMAGYRCVTGRGLRWLMKRLRGLFVTFLVDQVLVVWQLHRRSLMVP